MTVEAKMSKAEKKAMKTKRAAEEVEAAEPVAEKKSKKAKKAAEETVEPVVEEKKKKRKNIEEEETEVPESTAAEEAPAKKKSKKEKKSEEAVVEEEKEGVKPMKKSKKEKKAAEEAVVEEEKEEVKPMKKSKKEKKAAEEAVEDQAEEKVEEKKEEKEEDSSSEEPEVKVEEKKDETPAAAADEEENKSIIVFGLPFEATEETVKKDFDECGEITSFRMPIDRESGAHKGMAFVDYATMEGAKKALDYNETEYGGRTLKVRVCEKDGNKGGKGKDGGKGKGKGKKGKGKGSGEKPEGCTSLVVKFLAQETTEDKLWSIFEAVAPSKIKLLTDRDSGESKCVAFVDFEDGSKLEEAIKLNQTEVDGKNIMVAYNAPKGEGKGDGKKGGKGDGKKGGKGDGKKGGKGKKGKKGEDAAKAANQGKIQEFAGTAKTFDDSDSD